MKIFLRGLVSPFILPSSRAVDIDNESDWKFAEILFKSQNGFKAVFRVDSSTIFATGHVMRCLNIADQLKKL